MKHKRFKKRWLLLVPPAGVLAVAFVLFWPVAWLPHRHIEIALPFSAENEATSLIPMGETIEHPKPATPKGHPGIDFHWNAAVPLIASADGVVIDVKATDQGGDVTVRHNLFYETRYKEMDNIQVKRWQKVKRGQTLGVPHCTVFEQGNTHCQLHWEFASTSLARDRFCPTNYFDADSRRRIEAIWATVKPDDNKGMKRDFPEICSGDYLGAED